MRYYVSILTNRNHTVLYTGVTRALIRRVHEHRNNADPSSFTARYKVHKLVYFEETCDIDAAIEREKQIESWTRAKKIALICQSNPKFLTLIPIFWDESPHRSYRWRVSSDSVIARPQAVAIS